MLNLYHLGYLKIAKSIDVKHQYFWDVLIFTGDAFLSITCCTEGKS